MIKTVKDVIDNVKKYQIDRFKELSQQYLKIKSLEAELETNINRISETLAKNQESFSSDITKNEIPKLLSDCD